MVELVFAVLGLVLFGVYVRVTDRRAARLETEAYQAEKAVIAREQTIAERDSELGRLYAKIKGARTTIGVQERELWHCHREIDSLRARLDDATKGVASLVIEAVPSTRPDELSADIARIDTRYVGVFGDDDSPALQRRSTPISGRPVEVAS